MALTKCKECNADVSKKATQCPTCGAPVPKGTHLFTWVILVVLILSGISAIVGGGSSQQSSVYNAPTPTASLVKVEAKVACEQHYRDSAKYDVDLSWGTGDSIATKQGDTWLVDTHGKMQNGFGAWEKVTSHCSYSIKSNSVVAFDIE